MAWTIVRGNALAIPLKDKSVHCVVTSPPYWGLRDYGTDGQLGLEKTPEEYLADIVAVFAEVWRVLRDDGTVFLNLGDSYIASGGNTRGASSDGEVGRSWNGANVKRSVGLKPKDLVGIPWRVAFALQAAGWYLRSDIIWAKPNPMPESVTDRPTKSHEYIFLLSKSSKYYFDQEAVKESVCDKLPGRNMTDTRETYGAQNGGNGGLVALRNRLRDTNTSDLYRNIRSIWTIATQAYSGAHFATFPEELVEICIKAGTSEKGCCGKCGKPIVRILEKKSKVNVPRGTVPSSFRANMHSQPQQAGVSCERRTIGWKPSCKCDSVTKQCVVLDPFSGAGTTALVADKLGRSAIGLELSEDYCALAKDRIASDAPLLEYAQKREFEQARWKDVELL